MTSSKSVILTAIHIKGAEAVKAEAAALADSLLCSPAYVRKIVGQVEKGMIVTQFAA
jgi:alpha-D-ribose 1-methylphosphonate 5-triphosphate synthase subunit PhnG